MSAPTVNADALIAVLKPELEKLCRNAPLFGDLVLRASMHDGEIGRIVLGIETARKIPPRAIREGSRL
jgi:hypothetical protein